VVPDGGVVSSSSSAAAAAADDDTSQDSESSTDDDENKPDEAPLSAQAIISQVLRDSSLDIRVKQEGSAANVAPEERKRRKECRDKWVKANTDPRTKQGRFVFRRGCHKQCITQVLGGSGTHPWLIVKEVPTLPNGNMDNPFIKEGEYYVAGSEEFNPFGPRFPGDYGFVNIEAFDRNPDSGQTEFHLFVQCAEKPHKRHWHGPNAAGGRMYVGIYKRVVDDDEITSDVCFQSTDLDHTNKMAIASYEVKKDYQVYGTGKLRSDVQEQHKSIARSFVGDKDWNALTDRQSVCSI
jgi:hypothetical protein